MADRIPTLERRTRTRASGDRWQSALTSIAPNAILIRGYPVDEMMGRLSFAEAVYLLLMGELPTPAIGRMLNAVLVSSLDHGVTPPSTLAARNVATSGAPLKDCVAAGILAFGPHHGGDIESCMRFLDAGLTMVRAGRSCRRRPEAGRRLRARRSAPAGLRPPVSHPRSAGGAAVPDGARARARRRARPPAARDRIPARRPPGRARPAAGQRRRRHRRDLRRPGLRLRARQRDLPDLAAARPDRARARGTDAPAPMRPDRSHPTTATTARVNGGFPRRASSAVARCDGSSRLH